MKKINGNKERRKKSPYRFCIGITILDWLVVYGKPHCFWEGAYNHGVTMIMQVIVWETNMSCGVVLWPCP